MRIIRAGLFSALSLIGTFASALEPIPDKLVVLGFDDCNKSDRNFVADVLKEYGFGATFYVTEGLGFLGNKRHYVTWKEIKELNDMGFEIGNHTKTHPNVTRISREKFSKELYMSFGDTKKLIHNGMYVGGHGYNHLWMNEENRKSQETEIELTLEFLKNVGAPIKKWIMCYPFGAYNSETLSLLKEKNCSAGLTIKIGTNNLAKDNLFKLKRFDTNDFPKY